MTRGSKFLLSLYAVVVVSFLGVTVARTDVDSSFKSGLMRVGGGTFTGAITAPGVTSSSTASATKYNTAVNCASSGGTCTSASAGSVSIAAAATTVTVSTTAVTANSEIFVFEDSTLGTRLSVTCNTATGRVYSVTTRTPATSFIVTASAAPVTNPACLNFLVVN